MEIDRVSSTSTAAAPGLALPRLQCLMRGRWLSSDRQFEVASKFSGAVVARVGQADRDQVAEAMRCHSMASRTAALVTSFGHEGPRYAVKEMTEERLVTILP
jgi:hypothetical protein